MAGRTRAWLGVTALCLLAAVLLPAFPQPAGYHAFADRRAALGIDNAFNVASNAGFLVSGIAGLWIVFGRRARFELASERWPWAVFFLGLVLTAFGSAYYHLAPDNARLFWDRLPMTIAFGGLVASQVADRVDARAGVGLLLPLVLVGAATIVYWRWSERGGAGNVMPYVVLQAYAVVMLLWLVIVERSRYTRGGDLFWILGWYMLSKLLEALDAEVQAMGHVVSGHTLKHVAASGSGFVACAMLMRRELRMPGSVRPRVAVRS